MTGPAPHGAIPSNVLTLTSTSRAADAGFLTLADLSSIAVALELDHRIVGGHMVTLLTAAHGVAAQVPMRETLDADFAALPAVIADPRLPRALAECGYHRDDAANRFVRHHQDDRGPLNLAYGLAAVEKYGLAVGGRMAADRCKPHVPRGHRRPGGSATIRG